MKKRAQQSTSNANLDKANSANLYNIAYQLINSCFEMRLVEKLARQDISVCKKEQLVQQFHNRMEAVHTKLREIRANKQRDSRIDTKQREIRVGKHRDSRVDTKQLEIRVDVETQVKKQQLQSDFPICLESTTDMPYDRNRFIRMIEQRYREVFVEGSFKHYDRVRSIYNITREIKVIDAFDWCYHCLQDQILSDRDDRCC